MNNAGYGVSGAVEELTEQQVRKQIEVNLFGALWVTQAALPILREQGSGWIVQVSSIGGLAAFPLIGIYHASKWALEGFSESLRQEVEPFGIKVLMVEPSRFRTDWAGSSMDRAEPIDAYLEIEAIADRRTALRQENSGSERGNPDLAAQALLATLDRDDPTVSPSARQRRLRRRRWFPRVASGGVPRGRKGRPRRRRPVGRCRSRGGWEADFDSQAAAGSGLCVDDRVVGVGDRLHDREPEPHPDPDPDPARRGAFVGAVSLERFEQAG